MKKHVHFLLLVAGTAVFLFMMHRYTAPLVQNNDSSNDARFKGQAAVYGEFQTAIDYTVMDMNMNGLHTTYIVKASLWTFATYLSFVVIVFAHRLFYKPNRLAVQETPPVSV